MIMQSNDPALIPLQNFLEVLKNELIISLQANGKIATGQTAGQITITNSGGAAQLLLPGYLYELEKGRGPTGKNAVKGDPPMIQRIQQWCKAKGIPDKAAWAIKRSIDKYGYPGKPGLILTALSGDNIDRLLAPVLDELAEVYANQIQNLKNDQL